ncbi:MAG: hypothetical protein HY094_02800 [Candidatus Melainabacteria bacterium]|nr:hypothetical protein [Candidatus Melainabacteria bacterium]
MRVNLQKAVSLFFTGTSPKSYASNDSLEKFCPTDDELADMEMTRETWDYLQKNCIKFKDPTLSLGANWSTLRGYFRNSALSVFDSLFSGVGAGLSSKINVPLGLGLAASSVFTSIVSTAKKLPFLSAHFAFDNYGGRLIRSALHVFDSTFSRIGEKGAKSKLPSLVAGLGGLFTLNRVLNDKHNESIKMPYGTIGGTLGRTAIHHAESMLASKANELSNNNSTLSSFLATSTTTLGLLLPEKITEKNIPVETLEGLSSLVIPNFLDSLFSNIGNAFSPIFKKPKNLILGTLAFSSSIPVLSSIPQIWNYKAPMPKLGGKLIRSIFNIFEAISFNTGNFLGNSVIGIPLSIGFGLLTHFTCISKKFSSKFKNMQIPFDTVGSLFQRLPFGLLYSMTSAAGKRLSDLIPAPLLTVLGPALSFQIGERFKGVDAKYDELKGLMIRNSTHLWESTLASAAFKTGKMFTGTSDDSHSSGSLFGERWITDDGQIVQNMAMGKQMDNEKEKSIIQILIGSLSGIGFAVGAFLLGKYFMKGESNVPLEKENIQAVLQDVEPVRIPVAEPVILKYPKIQYFEIEEEEALPA